MKKSKRSSQKYKNFLLRPKNTWLAGGVLLFVVIVIGYAVIVHIQDNRENARRIEQLQQTDKDVQKFGNSLEQSFPGRVSRKKYCKHDSDKFGPGALHCTTSVKIKAKYLSEQNLVISIRSLNRIIKLQQQFKSHLKSYPINDQGAKATTYDSDIFSDIGTGMVCDSGYAFTHFNNPYKDMHGEFEFYLGCTTDALKNPVYKLEDF